MGHRHPWRLDGDDDGADGGCGVGDGGCVGVGVAAVVLMVTSTWACRDRHLSAGKLPVLSQWLLP